MLPIKIMKNKILKVPLKNQSYKIIIGNDIISNAGTLIKRVIKKPKAFIVTNKVLKKYHLPKLLNSLKKEKIEYKIILINDGEKKKNISTVKKISDELINSKIDRDDTLIAFGGGVLGDIVGFVASITLRGVDFIQIPTTLLAQVDSSVGGKTGVNTSHGKNLIGTFNQPILVLSDVSVLKTLNKRELKAGYSEVIKHALIMDNNFFSWLDKNFKKIDLVSDSKLIEAVYRSCKHKAHIVKMDVKESGVRAYLNYGHTFGHALEKLNNYRNTLKHGEAISIGMLMASHMSFLEGHLSNKDLNKIKDHFKNTSLLTVIPKKLKNRLSTLVIQNTMLSDKKVKNGKINLILLKKIGKAFVANKYKQNNLKKVIKDSLI